MNKIALWIGIYANDYTTERAIVAGNDLIISEICYDLDIFFRLHQVTGEEP